MFLNVSSNFLRFLNDNKLSVMKSIQKCRMYFILHSSRPYFGVLTNGPSLKFVNQIVFKKINSSIRIFHSDRLEKLFFHGIHHH
ncbi:hypothetical protein T10_6244 [Trichinella papuae]|uniref:Uncharacterized protein n=1 Tax=Trichinella papuae TaxID=268474 RepID=A0A0V1N2B0_9BILA|nr:hypothetical protein T10_6244 [Trichinella papuae]